MVLTLALAAAGFALLVIALITGSVIWAWACIVVCVIGAILLLASALSVRRTTAERTETERSVSGTEADPGPRGRHAR